MLYWLYWLYWFYFEIAASCGDFLEAKSRIQRRGGHSNGLPLNPEAAVVLWRAASMARRSNLCSSGFLLTTSGAC